MNNTWIGIIAAIIILAGGGYYFYSVQEETPTDEILTEENEKASRKFTLVDLFFADEDYRCEFSHDDGMKKSSGTAYLGESGERIRVDFSVEQGGGGPVTGGIVRKDGYSYLWSSAMEQGIRVAITDTNREDLFPGVEQTTINEGTEFDCVTWVENASVFELPENIEFVDMSKFGS